MRLYDVVPADCQWSLGLRRLDGEMYGYDVWMFTQCRPAIGAISPVPVEILADGPVADFNDSNYAVIISRRLADFLRDFLPADAAEYLPADVSGAEGEWEVLNLLESIDCLDRERSKIEYRDMSDPDRPGEPRSVNRMVLDPLRASGHDLFRLKDWKVAVIASERFKNAFQKAGFTGIDFWEVSD